MHQPTHSHSHSHSHTHTHPHPPGLRQRCTGAGRAQAWCGSSCSTTDSRSGWARRRGSSGGCAGSAPGGRPCRTARTRTASGRGCACGCAATCSCCRACCRSHTWGEKETLLMLFFLSFFLLLHWAQKGTEHKTIINALHKLKYWIVAPKL